MKNKRFWITASLLCIILGAILMVIGRLMGGQPGFYIDPSGVHAAGNMNRPAPIQDSMTLDEFDSMEIHADYADVELIYSNKFTIEYCVMGAYGEPVCEVKNGRLTFQEAKSSKYFNIGFFTASIGVGVSEPNYYIKVKLPKDTKLSEAVFDIESGNLDISSIQADTLNVKNEYGDVTLGQYDGRKLDVLMESGILSLDTVNASQTDLSNEYGKIELSKATGERLSIQMESCDLLADYIDYSGIEIINDYGKVDIKDAAGQSLTAKMESCDCKIDRLDFSETDITNSYGDITLGLSGKIENYGYNLKTEYGTIRIENQKEEYESDGGESLYMAAGAGEKMVTISCESGDIEIKAAE